MVLTARVASRCTVGYKHDSVGEQEKHIESQKP